MVAPVMYLVRRLMVCFLLMTVPFQGMAVMVEVKTPCPMTDMMGESLATDGLATSAAVTKGKCCLDDETVARTGELCKTGQECHSGQLMLIGSTSITTLSVAGASPQGTPQLNYSPHPLASIWRPPLSRMF